MQSTGVSPAASARYCQDVMPETVDPTPLPDYVGTALQEWANAQPLLSTLVVAAVLAIAAYLAFVLTRRLLINTLHRLSASSRNTWDDALKERRFFYRLSHFVPLLIVRSGLPYLPALPDPVALGLQRVVAVFMAVAMARAVSALVNAFGDIYARTPQATQRPIKGYLQVVVLVVYIMAAIVSLAVLVDRDPLVILTGFGAASAVLLLIFQNTILSLVAGIQLTNNDLIRVGDWIEMPDMNADGDVIEIALNNVTVQNWDKTFTIIPTHQFLGKSFKNWRGMQASGGRRIKRSLDIDLSTVRFLEEEDIQRLRKFAVLRPYFEEKRADIEAWRAQHPEALENPVNSRRLTNIGTFRAYVTRYLREHPMIAQDMTFLVRQLQPGEAGLPLEIYVFVNDVRWAVYESVQADIFDHLIAILPEFDLRLFQAPSGSDLRSMAQLAAGPRGEATAGALEGPARELQAGTKG